MAGHSYGNPPATRAETVSTEGKGVGPEVRHFGQARPSETRASLSPSLLESILRARVDRCHFGAVLLVPGSKVSLGGAVWGVRGSAEEKPSFIGYLA